MTELSREAILAMVPGRNLDALVAEKIMGWTLTDEHETVYDMEGRIEGGSLWRDDDGDAVFLRDYSTDIAAAWEVVEKISDNKFNVYVMRRSDGKHFTECKKVGSSADRLFTVFAEGPTAPEAICKAALLTTLEEESR